MFLKAYFGTIKFFFCNIKKKNLLKWNKLSENCVYENYNFNLDKIILLFKIIISGKITLNKIIIKTWAIFR